MPWYIFTTVVQNYHIELTVEKFCSLHNKITKINIIKKMEVPTINSFGQKLKKLRMKKDYSLREICKVVNYDSSNWSKIERGVLSPPSDDNTLIKWAQALGIEGGEKIQKFIDEANIAQGAIPNDLLASKKTIDCLPAFFRTIRNKKPSKEELNKLIEIIKSS